MKKLLPLIAVIVLAGAGCGRATPTPATNNVTTPATATQDKYNSCALFTKTDAEAVLGTTVNAPTSNGTTSNDGAIITSSCTYATTAVKPTDIKVANLLIRKATNLTEANKIFDEARKVSKSLSGVDPVDASGLGDRAYWAGGALNQLNVLKGDVWLIASIRDTKNKAEQQQATEVIRRALDNMTRL
jgi:hypothetical protein